jgi:hypothetical protein
LALLLLIRYRRFGLRAVIATLSPVILLVVHSFMGFTSVDPVGPLVGQGLAYSGFAAVIWPSIPLVVPPDLVGFAYGITFSIQSLGMCLFPLVIAAIYSDTGDKYIPGVEEFFVILAIIGVTVGFYLNVYDFFFFNSLLNKPTPKVHKGPLLREGSVDRKASREHSSSGSNNPLTYKVKNTGAYDDDQLCI